MKNMYQINFRVGEDEKEILEKIARIKNCKDQELIESEINALSKLDITQFLKNKDEEIKKPIL